MIHPTALVDSNAQIGNGVAIGPFSIVEKGSIIGDNALIGPRAHIFSHTRIGASVQVYDGAVVGAPPQDLKYAGESSWLEIGDGTIIREYCTLNRGTGQQGVTKIGRDVLLMAYTHVAHDCVLEDHVILANGVQLGGHVQIGVAAVIGGNTAVHQFQNIGAFAFVGGTLKVDRNVPPCVKAFGNPLRFAGINSIRMSRFGFSEARIRAISEQYRPFFNKKTTFSQFKESILTNGVADELLVSYFRKNSGKIITSV
jgi:UDP-N-acetylglucosamine acyltransferase